MTVNATEQCYLRTSMQEASAVHLVVVLYDLLVGDLRRAAAAMQCGNIEERSRRLKHGLLVLQLLEGSLDMKSEGPCAQSLSRFYSHIRSQLLAAQFSADATPLELQIALLLQVRESWQHLNASEAILEASRSAPDSVPAASCAATPEASADRSWSA